MNSRIYLNNSWKFTPEWTGETADPAFDESTMENIRIPHTVKELPLHYCNEQSYQMVSGYRRHLFAPEEWKGKAILLTFEGAAHDATVFLNGREAASHHCGYTAFTADISSLLNYGEDNIITVRLDSRETLNVPPFGFVIDYMTYGGIYRNVYLEIRSFSYIEDVFVNTDPGSIYEKNNSNGEGMGKSFFSDDASLTSLVTINNFRPGMMIRQSFRSKTQEQFRLLREMEVIEDSFESEGFAGSVRLWDVDDPALYQLKTELIDSTGTSVDEVITTFGFRIAEFRKDGFWLNGRKLRIRGLNRHQAYPYVGYAMPDTVQREDADILKRELGVNAVRTSHYPQAQSFIDRCDELGLLVFTEFPGWQHIGDESWKNQALTNLTEMICQYRNHPSIILWGVRINESIDDEEFYSRTNQLAHHLDPSRQTGGVRCYKKGFFQEDVFTYNDFSHNGLTAGCENKSKVTPDIDKPYLITEYNGHMFPTKAYDDEEHRLEHALRHARVLNSVAGKNDISGSFGWVMNDYNTHKDFGSGDRVCYHGVMDMFRNPKMAAYVYAIQQDDRPVLEISSSMDIGEHPGSCRGDVYVFTNSDKVRMYRNDKFIREFDSSSTPFANLHHGPFIIDDYIGDTLRENEDFTDSQAHQITRILNLVARKGLYGLPKKVYLSVGKLFIQYHMKPQDLVDLYNRYIGDWGSASGNYRFDAIKDGKVVKSVTKAPMNQVKLSLESSRTALIEGNSYDVASIRIRATDERGNVLPYFNDPLVLHVEGALELMGPDIISLAGGMGGTYVKTTGSEGTGKLTVSSTSGASAELEFTVRTGGDQ